MRKFLIAGALLASAMSTAAFAARQDFTVTNHTGHTIRTLNVSPNNDSHWGPDILGREVLADNEQTLVTFDRNEDQCSWDIQVTYDDGTNNDLRAVNLCETSEVEFTA
jgi:Flp pilus assembly protein TadG